jgi:thioredoxin-dependent peroxiredoxin
MVRRHQGRGWIRALTDDEAKKLYPNGWKTPKPYMRVVAQPGM